MKTGGLESWVSWYRDAFDSRCLRENALVQVPVHLSEVEVQARWFSGEFGADFLTTSGETVQILQFGIWNREAGPDFAEAAISINGGPPMRGCIELDREVRDWDRHGHSSNPDYESVILHVFWETRAGDGDLRAGRESAPKTFTRTALNRCVPQVRLDLESRGSPGKTARVESAMVPQSIPGRCSGVLSRLEEAKVREIIEGASRFRFARKTAQLANLVRIHGPDEALYQSLAVTMGYKANKLPFSLLAQRLPLGVLHRNKDDAEGLLFGSAGFIDSTDLSLFDLETRAYLRGLWQQWWPRRAEFQRLVLEKSQWRFCGMRPANDPHRRVAALVQLTKRWGQLRYLSRRCRVGPIRKFFASLRDDFWDCHFSFHCAISGKKAALVGASRVNDMLANVFFPFAAAQPSQGLRSYGDASALWRAYQKLPASLSNRRVEIAATRLFGTGPWRSAFQKSLSDQQGLLQIYEDFCSWDASDCLRCPFPEQCVR